MKQPIYKSKEIEALEAACGVNAEIFIPDRKPENVDLRDIFVWINFKNTNDTKTRWQCSAVAQAFNTFTK